MHGLPSLGTTALARKSLGETHVPLSPTPSHNPFKQQAVKYRVMIGSFQSAARIEGTRNVPSSFGLRLRTIADGTAERACYLGSALSINSP